MQSLVCLSLLHAFVYYDRRLQDFVLSIQPDIDDGLEAEFHLCILCAVALLRLGTTAKEIQFVVRIILRVRFASETGSASWGRTILPVLLDLYCIQRNFET